MPIDYTRFIYNRREISNVLREWLKTHRINRETGWFIQNLLGEYFGFNSDEHKNILKELDKYYEELELHPKTIVYDNID